MFIYNMHSSAPEKNKQWQREMLMERIRSRGPHQKSYAELSKSMRMSMLEKRYALDAVEKTNLQKCLDSMQHCIKVTSRQGLVERLESLSRQLGLKFMEDVSSLFISCDMFYVEILLDSNDKPNDVKVHHECKIEQQSCSELVECLNRGDFADFTVQLEGLSSIYQLNAEPKVKTKAFVALQAMENDLLNMFRMQSLSKDIREILDNSTVGFVESRRGGHPMKLIYFVSPYDRISSDTEIVMDLSKDLIMAKEVGAYVTVHLEASSANKLQILPIVSSTTNTQTGKDIILYAPLTPANSMLLPATFVLRLNKAIPVCYASLCNLKIGTTYASELNSINSMELQNKTVISTIMNLTVQTASQQEISNSNKGLFVCLPDQTHCYFFSENKQLRATMISSICFTEPSQVPHILAFLKKHALFYTLLSSCVRPVSKTGNDVDSAIILEVYVNSFNKISVSLQHPYEESMVTIEFDLGENVNVTIYSSNNNYDAYSAKLTNAAKMSLSIPLTIRKLLKFWDREQLIEFKHSFGDENGSAAQGNIQQSDPAFGSFNLADGGRSRSNNSGSISGVLKMEQSMKQQNETSFGLIQYRGDVKKDFYKSPKGLDLRTGNFSVQAGSLGHSQYDKMQHLTKIGKNDIVDKYKTIWKKKTCNLKHSVSITPISVEHKSSKQNLELNRQGGIEIIPLTNQSSNPLAAITSPPNVSASTSTTITITPIHKTNINILNNRKTDLKSPENITTNVSAVSLTRALETICDSTKEKKRKRKRDESLTIPPDPNFPPQHFLNLTTGTYATHKFSSSPISAMGDMVPSGSSSSISARQSPKHSLVYCSPKLNTALNSPKSPFNSSSLKLGSSGKPCMSTLKNATAANLSPKNEKSSASIAIGGINVGENKLQLFANNQQLTNTSSTASSSINAVKFREKDKTISIATTVSSLLTATKNNVSVSNMQQLKSVSHLNVLSTPNSVKSIDFKTNAPAKNVSSAVS